MTGFVRAWFRFADEHTRLYLSLCLLLGYVLRIWLAHGDWVKVIDPRFPLFT